MKTVCQVAGRRLILLASFCELIGHRIGRLIDALAQHILKKTNDQETNYASKDRNDHANWDAFRIGSSRHTKQNT